MSNGIRDLTDQEMSFVFGGQQQEPGNPGAEQPATEQDGGWTPAQTFVAGVGFGIVGAAAVAAAPLIATGVAAAGIAAAGAALVTGGAALVTIATSS